MHIKILILIGISSLLLTGCQPSDKAELTKFEEAPSYETLKEVNTYVIGQSHGLICPSRVYPLVAYKPGELLLLAGKGEIKAGTIWARYTSTGLDERLQAINDKEKEFMKRSETFRSTELRLEMHTLEEALVASKEALEISQALENASDSTRAAIEIESQSIEPPHIIETRIELLNKQIEELRINGRSNEERDILTDFRINREEIESLIESHNLKVPFDGVVEFSNSIEPGKPLHVAAAQNLGTLVDYSEVYLRMELTSTVLTNVKPEDLTILTPNLPKAELTFSHSNIEEVRSTMVPIHYYKISGLSNPRELIGKAVPANICVTTESPLRIVTKTSLLRWGRGDTWQLRLSSLYPEAQIVYEGNYDVAVR